MLLNQRFWLLTFSKTTSTQRQQKNKTQQISTKPNET